MATATIECASFRNGLVRVTADYDTVTEALTSVTVVNDSDVAAFVQVTRPSTGQSASRTVPAQTTASRAIPAGLGMRIGRTVEDDGGALPSIASDTISFSARVPA